MKQVQKLHEPTGCSSSCDLRAGERLHSVQIIECGSIVLQSSHDSSSGERTKMSATKNDESVDKDAS